MRLLGIGFREVGWPLGFREGASYLSIRLNILQFTGQG